MDEQERIAKALDYHHAGYNCAQSTVLAVADLAGLAPDEAYRLLEGFGGGMGGFSETCGAISGAVAAVSYAKSGGLGNPITKRATYELSKEMVDRFRVKNGSTRCPALKGLEGEPAPHPCDDYVADGVALAYDLLTRK
ncbi:MAG: C-GCAxxG-C-C family protein [Eggerthellaceae bacterium]|jgi:C_GCAxxG_C_C family probable redox protein